MTCSHGFPCLSAFHTGGELHPTSLLDSGLLFLLHIPLLFGESWSCCLGQADLLFSFHGRTRELPKIIRGECQHVDVCVLMKGGALGKAFTCLLQIWCFTMAGIVSTAAVTYFKRKVCTKLKATSVHGQKKREVVKINYTKECFASTQVETFWPSGRANAEEIVWGKSCDSSMRGF